MRHETQAMLLAAGLLAAGCATVHQTDASTLQGTWRGQIKGGGDSNQQCEMVISGQNYSFRSLTDTNIWYKGTYTLREDTNPRQFICVVAECPFPQYVGKSSLAIYRIEGGTLKFTGNEPGVKEVPASFDAQDAAQAELKRK